jgi:hypothetical protein
MRSILTPILGVTLCVVMWSPLALAQAPATVGDLLSGGGKRLTRDEVTSLLAGATESGPQIGFPQIAFETTHKTDGTTTGWALGPNVDVKVSGTWKVDDQGRFCRDLLNTRGQKVQGCAFYFVRDGTYYAAPADAGSERVYRREIKR